MTNLSVAAVSNLYTIHCASYKDETKAANDVKKLLAMDYDAFSKQVEIKTKGKWYRVYVGRFATKEKAKQTANLMINKKIISQYFIYPLLPDPLIKKISIPANIKKDIAQKKSPSLIIEKRNGKAEKTEHVTLDAEENTGSPLYDKGTAEMKEKNYEKALTTFKEFLDGAHASNRMGEKALRRMADCHYFLGEKGSNEHSRIAVEFYKNTLNSFPDPRKENSTTYFYLAKTYERLKKYPDAIKSFENILFKYPEFNYIDEAAYKIGELLYYTGKYNQAADKLIAYLIKYRGGIFAKQSFYMVADCYYRMQQSASADIWFNDAQKKWPNFIDIPKKILLDMGHHKYSLHRYDEAIKIYSTYVNLYPDDEKLQEIFLQLANTYKSAAQVSAALNIFNLIIDRYPESKEARESILAMASLGVDNPGIKIFPALVNFHYYRYPIEAYDKLLAKNKTGEIAETAMLKKAEAWHKSKRDSKAIETYMEFLKKYSQSKLIDEARKGLRLASGNLIEEYYSKKDYLAVADIYYKVYQKITLLDDEFDKVNKMALSMREIGLMEDYLKLLRSYKNICKDEQIAAKVMLHIAEGEMAGQHYNEAEKILDALMGKPELKNTTLMTDIKKNYAEIAYQKGIYDKAVVDFDAVISSGQNINDPVRTFWHYAASLKGKKDNSRALQNYLIAAKYLKQDKQASVTFGEAYKEMGDIYFEANDYSNSLDMYNKVLTKSSPPDLKYWALLFTGNSYLKMEKNNEAQKTFNQIKNESGAEGFWAQIVDYYNNDQKWWDKYREYLRNK